MPTCQVMGIYGHQLIPSFWVPSIRHMSTRACEQVIVGDIQKKKGKHQLANHKHAPGQTRACTSTIPMNKLTGRGIQTSLWLLGLPIDACQCPVARPHAVLQWHDSGWLTSSDQPSFWRTNLIDEPRMAGAGHCKVGRAWLPWSTRTHPLCMKCCSVQSPGHSFLPHLLALWAPAVLPGWLMRTLARLVQSLSAKICSWI